MKADAIIVAGGKGTRMGYSKNKVLMEVCGKEIIIYTLEAFSKNKYIDNIYLVVGKDDLTVCHDLVKKHGLFKVKKIVEGGATRQESVYQGLLCSDAEYVCIHDGARAFILDDVICKTIENAYNFGASAPGVKCKDTLKKITDDGFIESTVDREKTVLIQTPQVFLREQIFDCHERAKKEEINVTDDCALAEHYGIKIKITDGSYDNLKVTTPEDILIIENLIKKERES